MKQIQLAHYFIATLLLGSISTSVAGETRVDARVGLSQDFLQWSIANDITGTATPNILSELTWDDLLILQQSVGIEHFSGSNDQFFFTGRLTYGLIFSGDNQDSDYSGNNRTNEFSRSNNSADQGSTTSASIGVGFSFKNNEKDFALIPMVGYAENRQNLRITDGNQTIPANGAFSGLNSTYDATWNGPWVGLKVVFGDTVRMFVDYRYHQLDYVGLADWNLRADFQHPVSFRHDADGIGQVLELGIIFQPKDTLALGVTVISQRWETDPGLDTTYFSSGAVATTRLNEVIWTSTAILATLTYSF